MESLIGAATGVIPVVLRADEADDIRGAIKFAGERKLKLIIAGGLEAWKCTDVLKKANVPVLLTVDRLPRSQSDPTTPPTPTPPACTRPGSASPSCRTRTRRPRNLPYEAAMARAYGLPADVALRAITLTPAEIFGVGDQLGSLSEGKDANVVVATGDIMDARTAVKYVFIDGVEQPLTTRHTRLYDQFKGR
jgi:imidazolonepropionase-like amidohydrolase